MPMYLESLFREPLKVWQDPTLSVFSTLDLGLDALEILAPLHPLPGLQHKLFENRHDNPEVSRGQCERGGASGCLLNWLDGS